MAKLLTFSGLILGSLLMGHPAFAQTPPPASSTPLSALCIPDSGSPPLMSVCKSSLPRCSKMKADLIQQVKTILSYKIYAWYLGIDLDLSKGPDAISKSALDASTGSGTGTYALKKSDLVGTSTSQGICSVVGHGPLQLSASATSIPGAEIETHSIYDQITCGSRPDYIKGRYDQDEARVWTISLKNGKGSMWSAYQFGAYPWIIRAKAKEVLSSLDLMNLDPDRVIPALDDQIQAQPNNLSTIYSKMSPQEKLNCNAGKSCKDLGLTDSNSKICASEQVGLSTQKMVQNLILYRIMKKANEEYTSNWVNLINTPDFVGFFEACGAIDTTIGLKGMRRGKLIRYAKTASCILSGNKTPRSKNGDIYCTGDSDGSNKAHATRGPCTTDGRDAAYLGRIKLTRDGNGRINIYAHGKAECGEYDCTTDGGDGNDDRCVVENADQCNLNLNDLTDFSLNAGIAGVFEKKIRNFCGQNKITDPDKYCASSLSDPFHIPSIPSGVKNP